MNTRLRMKAGFDWGRLAWGKPDSPVRPFCAYCHAYIPDDDVPLMFWADDGSAISLCEACSERWIEVAK